MKKIILMLIGCIVAMTAVGQVKRVFELHEVVGVQGDTLVSILLKSRVIVPKDGLTVKFTVPQDTAKLFIPDDGAKYEATTIFRKLGTVPPVTPPLNIPAISFTIKTSGTVNGNIFTPIPGTIVTYAVPSGYSKIQFTYALADVPAIQLRITHNGVLIFDGAKPENQLGQTGGWGNGNMKTTLPIAIPMTNAGSIVIACNRGFDFGAIILSK